MGVSFHFADPLHPSNDKTIMEFLKIDGCKLTLPQNRWVQLHPLHLSNDATVFHIHYSIYVEGEKARKRASRTSTISRNNNTVFGMIIRIRSSLLYCMCSMNV